MKPTPTILSRMLSPRCAGLAALLATALALPALAADPAVPYPNGYRDWRHVKSMVIERGHPLFESFGGLHHLYANPKAVAGYRAGSFPDGAVIVLDLLEAPAADHTVTEGGRKLVGVMVKNKKAFAATGGWGFEGFAGGDPAQPVVKGDAASACFACHTARKGQDHVFSQSRD